MGGGGHSEGDGFARNNWSASAAGSFWNWDTGFEPSSRVNRSS
jgi:hypothetical protein